METPKRTKTLRESINFANWYVTDEKTRLFKFKKMLKSPLAFYRATCDLFYRDLANDVLRLPKKWKEAPETWISGDFHLGNVGFFEGAKGKIIFDLNDFDESCIAPFYLDFIRFGTALFLFRDEVDFDLSKAEVRDLISDFLYAYRKTLSHVRENDKETVMELTGETLRGFVKRKALKLANNPDIQTQLSEWTEVEKGVRKFKKQHKELGPVGSWEKDIRAHWDAYRKTLSASEVKSSDFLKIKDIAARLKSGLGSLGVQKFYVLVEGAKPGPEHDLILELKEQLLPSIYHSLFKTRVAKYEAQFSSHAARNVLANRVMLTHSNPLIGFFDTANASFLVRPIAPHCDGYDPEEFKLEKHLGNFVKFAAKLLALAHSRSDSDSQESLIKGNFEKKALKMMKTRPKFDKRLIGLCEEYAYRVMMDWKLFRKMRKEGEFI